MKRILLILMAVASVAQSCFAGLRQYHMDNCYVASDKCLLFAVINIRAGWWPLLLSDVHEGWPFKLRDGSLVNVIDSGNQVCTVLGTNGKIFYIGTDCLTDSPSWGFDTKQAEPPAATDDDWARPNAARIDAEKKAKAAAGPTKEELERAAHDAEIRANNERALKELSHE
jgi:hypothetical protein